MKRKHLVLAAGACALVCVTSFVGCGDHGPDLNCQPVRGQVMVDGKPVAEAYVVFHPTTPIADWNAKPRASTDADGRFTLTTDKASDGAPPGAYQVTVELRGQRQVGEELVRDGAQLLPERYRQPEKSGIQVTIVEGANELPRFELKKK